MATVSPAYLVSSPLYYVSHCHDRLFQRVMIYDIARWKKNKKRLQPGLDGGGAAVNLGALLYAAKIC